MAELDTASEHTEPDFMRRTQERLVEIATAAHRLTPALMEICYMSLLGLETKGMARVLDTTEGVIRVYLGRCETELRKRREGKGKSD